MKKLLFILLVLPFLSRSQVANGWRKDVDVVAFNVAATITDPVQQGAIIRLVFDYKFYSIWTPTKAIYPVIGGTATTCKWNLKDPRDLDAAFRLTFSNSPTITSAGIAWNGSNQYSDSHLNMSTNLTQGNVHFSYYSTANNAVASESVMGADDGVSKDVRLIIRRSDNLSRNIGLLSGSNTAYSTTDGSGFFVGTAVSSATAFYRNGSTITLNSSSSGTSGGCPNLTSFIGAYNNAGSPAQFTTKPCSFASIGAGLTSTDVSNLYTIVLRYETALGR